MTDLSSQMNEKDCAIIFTVQDNTGSFRAVVNTLKENNCPVICFTMSQALSFKKKCDQYIVLPGFPETALFHF